MEKDTEGRAIYFDNAATTWPKPKETIRAMVAYAEEVGGSPGRSGHRRAVMAGRIIFEAREALAEIFGCDDPFRIVFAKNATEAINTAILGLLEPGDHVVVSSLEHNSVMRPLRHLEKRGLRLTVVPPGPDGVVEPDRIEDALGADTRLICLTHASNVTGQIQPAASVGEIARRRGVLFLLDAAQTAGAVPIDVREARVDLMAFSGHKSLFGPQGTGGLYIGEGVEELLRPLIYGGTGSRSEFEAQPDFLPDKYESGTPNTIGIAGLGAGVRFVLSEGIRRIREREEELTGRFLAGLAAIPGVRVHGPQDASSRTAVVSFTLEGVSPSEAAMTLEEEFGILCRPGLHCAPSAHRTIGTFPAGTVRFGFGYFNTDEEIDRGLEALRKIRRHNT